MGPTVQCKEGADSAGSDSRHLPANRVPGKADWSRLSLHWQAQLDARIAMLTQLRDQLDSCIGCGCLSLQACPLRNDHDCLAAQGAGPHFR